MSRIYTGGGDRGETRLWDGARVSKLDPRIELNGTLDETGASIGLARALGPASMKEELLGVQKLLQDLMAYVARGCKEGVNPPAWQPLEAWIDATLEAYPMKAEFVFPGDSPAGGALHVARTVARRAERIALPLWDGENLISEDAYRFINRLSDLLYVLAHKADVETQVERIVRQISGENGQGKGQDGESSPSPIQELTLDEALQIIEAAKAAAESIKVPMVVAVCAPDGTPLAFQRMRDSLPVSVRLATDKAATALKLKMDTDALAPLVQPGAPLYGLTGDPSIVAFGGGRLLRRGGIIVGAVGVSGGSVEEDMQAAGAAVYCFENIKA